MYMDVMVKYLRNTKSLRLRRAFSFSETFLSSVYLTQFYTEYLESFKKLIFKP